MEYLLYFFSFIISLCINGNKKIAGQPYEKILVIKLDHTGDVITSLPAVDSIRKRFPGSNISFAAGSRSKEIVENRPDIDTVYVYNSKRFARGQKTPLFGRIKTLRLIFQKKYDLIIGLRDDWLTIICSLIYMPSARADRGTVRLKMKLKRLFSFSKRDNYVIHEVDTNLVIVEMAGAQPVRAVPCIFISEEERKSASGILSSFHIREKKYVVISPGAKWEYRRWNVEKFALLADNIKSRFNMDIVISGTNEESGIAEEMSKLMKEESINISGRTTIKQSAAVIEKSALLIANDGGMVHLASAMNVPTAAIFGPQDPERFGPWSEKSVVFHKKVDCFPCSQKKCKRRDNPCVNRIETEEVFSGIKNILQGDTATF